MGKATRGTALAVALVVSALVATSALGSTAQITRASVNSSWTKGSFAGTVEWTGCDHGVKTIECTWTPYAAIAVGESSESCEPPDRDPVWEGPKESAVGSQSFEVNDFPLDGNSGKVLCVGVIETHTEEIPCAPPGEPIPPGWHCPYKTTSADISLAVRVLEASAEPDHSHGTTGEAEPPKPVRQGCRDGSRKRQNHCIRHRHRRISLSQHQKVP